jgi:hypothetical protein
LANSYKYFENGDIEKSAFEGEKVYPYETERLPAVAGRFVLSMISNVIEYGSFEF